MSDNHLNGKKPMTDLDKRLQEMALLNWAQFVALVGEGCIKSAKVCLLRQKGRSLGEIAQKLQITYRQSEWGCRKCDIPGGEQAEQISQQT